ncbi:DUF1615 domain-containing protein [Xanthomonas vesicatoria]|uniref:DUF1615 domain-containing protein n=3 Tax=Xanthomonas vesicatoria TaxID=56460 RepID=A0AAJ0IYV7_9XANT|nr:DUF1615 domain-containing protein [Xanthomonas vesicatoria]APO96340.1 hypothetical protein BI313_18685 [Xanthomonas vesicatoria]APP76438.1 hypothetical protein BJD12_15735 [Xanthomonas vesicatoria ATCC 35937]EGD09198.1 domain of unknown function (DUF1615) protein [Xanthomonas vesicatoria ATCC 35937]KHM95018.1 lipoprotein [Xanthomonas vesicatoria]KHM96879.1 lipoprotein [Xanthomonas vesicatoria]
MTFPLPRLLALMAIALLSACATQAPRAPQRSPEAVKADIARRLPANLPDRAGWANDVYVALSSQALDTSAEHICAVLAVTEQESTYQANPAVPNLGKISRAEIDRRASAHHIPAFMVDAALRIASPDGRSYATRIATARTEQELSRIFEDFTGSVPLGTRLFDGLNPVHTAGPMQVSIAFAEQHAARYPYPIDGSIRHEVFSRRGGLWFGTTHLLGYPASYDALLYRFADFNAGWYASRNAAFQAALSKASGIALALDGDLLTPGASLEAPGGTERAVRALGSQLAMSDRQIRTALEAGNTLEFEDSALYRQVFALADRNAGTPLPRAMLPGITLDSPKITRTLTTAWFAQRVNERWKRCMGK